MSEAKTMTPEQLRELIDHPKLTTHQVNRIIRLFHEFPDRPTTDIPNVQEGLTKETHHVKITI